MITCSAHAHHGLDFLLLQDGTIPKPGSTMLFDNTEWSTFNGEDEWGTEPGFYLGVTPWLAMGTTASIIDEGNGWHYLSTTPYLNVPLFKSDRVPWLKVSFYAGYELPDHVADVGRFSSFSSKQSARARASNAGIVQGASPLKPPPSGGNGYSIQAKRSPTVDPRVQRHVTGGSVGGGGPDSPPTGVTHDHPVASAQSSRRNQGSNAIETVAPIIVAPLEEAYLGIHRHGEEGLHARLIVDVNLSGHDKLLANIINFTPAEGEAAWGYALGYRHAFNHDLATSLEAIGDFDGRGSHEVLVAMHRTIDHNLTLKLGVGMGLTPDSPDASVHAGVVWRF